MSRLNKVSWTDADAKRIERTVRNYNRRLKRAKDKFPERTPYLPQKASIADFKRRLVTKDFEIPDSIGDVRELKPIASREDFNREIEKLEDFTQATSALVTDSTGVTRTLWQDEQAEKLRDLINERKAFYREGVTEETGTMSQLERSNLEDKEPFKGDSFEEFNRYVESMEMQLGDVYTFIGLDQYKQNYIKAAYDQLGSYADNIVDMLDQIDDETFFRESNANPFLTIAFNYDPINTGEKALYINIELKKLLNTQFNLADRPDIE